MQSWLEFGPPIKSPTPRCESDAESIEELKLYTQAEYKMYDSPQKTCCGIVWSCHINCQPLFHPKPAVLAL